MIELILTMQHAPALNIYQGLTLCSFLLIRFLLQYSSSSYQRRKQYDLILNGA